MPDKKDRVYFCECWCRDGLQNVEKIISTDDKVAMINAFSQTGYARIETTSFSNPKRLPQFADALDVLKKIERNPDVSYKVTCINDKALDRAIEAKKEGCGPNEISTMISVSEPHNKYNTGMTHETHWKQISAMIELAHKNDIRVIATLGTVYGCPIVGDVPPENVYGFVKRYVDLGAQFVCLGDTTGAGNPRNVKEMFGELRARYPKTTFVAHFHDTRGTGLANALAAYEAGVRYFDSALGGIGGQPAGGTRYHLGFSGNVCTEDLASMFEEMGIPTGLDLNKMLENGHRAEEVLGEPQRSNVLRCGLVVHKPEDYAAGKL